MMNGRKWKWNLWIGKNSRWHWRYLWHGNSRMKLHVQRLNLQHRGLVEPWVRRVFASSHMKSSGWSVSCHIKSLQNPQTIWSKHLHYLSPPLHISQWQMTADHQARPVNTVNKAQASSIGNMPDLCGGWVLLLNPHLKRLLTHIINHLSLHPPPKSSTFIGTFKWIKKYRTKE